MRTTVDLPPELMRAAKVAAAERGETLKELFVRALSRELGAGTAVTGGRVKFPLVGSADRTLPRVAVTYSDLEAALDAEDAEKYLS